MMGAYNRDVSRRKALRKKRITEHYYWHRENGEPYYDNLHQFSKNKIHCSCPMCSQKTKNKGQRKVTTKLQKIPPAWWKMFLNIK